MALLAAKVGRVQGARSYVLIDNSNSPVPLVQTQPNGEVLIVAPGEVLEAKAMMCAHCNSLVVLNPKRTRAREWCRRCNAYICGRYGCAKECNYTLEMLDLALKYPNLPTLLRSVDGSPLYDTALRDKHRFI